MTASTQASLRVSKTTAYKGGTKTWSNRYHMNQTAIDTLAHFNTLADAVVAAEKAQYTSAVTIVSVIGYNGGSEVPVYSKTYSTAGTMALGSGLVSPLFVCGLVRYSTTQRSTKNHPIYLFNYYHFVIRSPSGDVEAIGSTQLTAYGTYAAAWIAGFSDGVTTYKRAGPRGAVAQGHFEKPEVTHRDFRD